MGHKWHIDENHMMWWDGEPYIRYGFTGDPSTEKLEEFIDLGFNHFNLNLGPVVEDLWVISGNPEDNEKAVREISEHAERITSLDATYYAGLNT